MNVKTPLYLQVYDAIVKEIFNGDLKTGDKLLSKTALSKKYHVGEGTIKLAVKQLRAAGFITTEKRKAAIVSFNLEEPKTKENVSAIYAIRKTSVIERLFAYKLIFPPVLAEGAKKCPKEKIQQYHEQIHSLSPHRESILVFRETLISFFTALISPFHNEVIENLFYETAPFYILPIPPSGSNEDPFYPIREEMLHYCCQLTELIAIGNFDEIAQFKPDIIPIIENTEEQFLQYIKPSIFMKQPAKSASNNHFLYLRILESITRKILEGSYPEGTLLPSETTLCSQYSVGRVTIRTAIHLLNEIGILQTAQGKGTHILTLAERKKRAFKANVFHPVVKKYLQLYFEVLELISLTGIVVSTYAAECASPEAINILVKKVKAPSKSSYDGNVYYAMLLLDFVSSQIENGVIKQLTLYMIGFLYWGLYFETTVYERFLPERKAAIEIVYQAADALQNGNYEVFAKQYALFFVRTEKISLKSYQFLTETCSQ